MLGEERVILPQTRLPPALERAQHPHRNFWRFGEGGVEEAKKKHDKGCANAALLSC